MGKTEDEMILSYDGVVIRRSDLEILRSPFSFINDRLISFYFAQISSSISMTSDRALLVPPPIAFWLSHCSDLSSRAESAASLRLSERDLILFPVNDNLDLTLAEGGAHWSLLVYDRARATLFHHDSCEGANIRHARRLCDSVKGFLGQDARFEPARTPQQTNPYDCGLYVMAEAAAICRWFRDRKEGNGLDSWDEKMEAEVDEQAVAALRQQLFDLIIASSLPATHR